MTYQSRRRYRGRTKQSPTVELAHGLPLADQVVVELTRLTPIVRRVLAIQELQTDDGERTGFGLMEPADYRLVFRMQPWLGDCESAREDDTVH